MPEMTNDPSVVYSMLNGDELDMRDLIHQLEDVADNDPSTHVRFLAAVGCALVQQVGTPVDS